MGDTFGVGALLGVAPVGATGLTVARGLTVGRPLLVDWLGEALVNGESCSAFSPIWPPVTEAPWEHPASRAADRIPPRSRFKFVLYADRVVIGACGSISIVIERKRQKAELATFGVR